MNFIGGLSGNSKCAIQTLMSALIFAFFTSVTNASVTYQINNGGLENFNLAIDGNNMNGALAGGIQISKISGDASMPASYITLCTDIEGTLYLGQSYGYVTPTVPFNGQTGVNPTWGAINTPAYLNANTTDAANASQAIQNAAYLFYNYGQLTSTGLGGTTEQKAALQLAVWAALYNTTALGTVTGSRFTVNSGDATAISQANDWISALNSLSDAGDFGYTGYLLYPTQGAGVNSDGQPPQELLIGAPVPESPTVIAGALLLLPLVGRVPSRFSVRNKKNNSRECKQAKVRSRRRSFGEAGCKSV